MGHEGVARFVRGAMYERCVGWVGRHVGSDVLLCERCRFDCGGSSADGLGGFGDGHVGRLTTHAASGRNHFHHPRSPSKVKYTTMKAASLSSALTTLQEWF